LARLRRAPPPVLNSTCPGAAGVASGLPAWPAVAPASSDAPLRREPRTIPASTTPSRTPNSLTVRSSPTGCPRPDSGAHGDLDRWHGRHLQRGRSAAADSETAGQKFCADAVRDCPQIPGATIALVRTYGGQRQVFTPYLRMFIKVSGYSGGLGGAVCKTVGSAYVGSNPTPATLFPQVRAGVIGWWHRLLRAVHRPLVKVCGPAVGHAR